MVQDVKTDEEVSPDVMEEFTALVEDIAAGQRDPSIPGGTELGTTSVEGMPATWKKQNSMHHLDGQPLPERMPLYHFPDNEISMIPTSLIFKRLSRVDNGHKTWSRKPFADGVETAYITKEVPVMSGGTMTKKFLDEPAYETWMQNKDPNRWASMLRIEEREARDEERAYRQQASTEQAELARALLASATGTTAQISVTPSVPMTMIEHLPPEGLKALADEFEIELSDRRSPETMRAEIRVALGGEA